MITTPQTLKEYRAQLKQVLKNQFLGTTLNNFAVAYRTSRANAFVKPICPALDAE